MKTTLFYKTLILVGALMVLALGAEAQTSVMPGIYNPDNTNQTNLEIKGEVELQTGETNAEGDPDRPVTTGGNSNDKATPKLTEPTVGGSASAENESDLEFLRGNSISVKAVEVRGWDAEQKQEFLMTVKAQAELRSNQDLENFARGILLRDENVTSVSMADEQIQVTYKMPAFLFGTFDSSLRARVEADAEGRVKARYPWYAFFFQKAVSSNDLAVEVETALPEVDDEVLVSFEFRAQILQNIANTLKARHDIAKNSIVNAK